MMNTLIGVTMIAVGLSRILTGGFVTGTIFTLWGIRILKKVTK